MQRRVKNLAMDLAGAAVVTDMAGRIEWASSAFARLTGYGLDELAGRNIRLLKSGRHPAPFYREMWQTILAGRVWHGQIVNLRKDRTPYTAAVTIAPVHDSGGAVRRFVSAQQDITEWKRTETLLRARVRHLERVGGVVLAAARGAPPNVLLRLIGRGAAESVDAGLAVLWVWDDRAHELVVEGLHGHAEWLRAHRTRPGIGVAGVTFERARPVVVDDYAGVPSAEPPLLDPSAVATAVGVPLAYGDRTVGVLEVAAGGRRTPFGESDVATLSHFAAEAAVALGHAHVLQSAAHHRKEVRALAARLVAAEEAERQRVSRHLHDLVGQNLSLLSFELSRLGEQADPAALSQIAGRLAGARRLVEETAARIRTVMVDLRPPVLDEFGVFAALRWYGVRYGGQTGIEVSVEGAEPSPRLAPQVEIALFRVAQEALTNVAKHAQARKVSVVLEGGTSRVRLTIADDGRGFDAAARSGVPEQAHWGLMTMRERTAAMGGTLQVDSRPGEGTRVVVEVRRGVHADSCDVGG